MEATKGLNVDIEDGVLADLIIDAIRDIKGENIIKIDLRKVKDAPSQYFVICDAESSVKINAISPKEVVGIEDMTGDVTDHTYITAMGLLRVGYDTMMGSADDGLARA